MRWALDDEQVMLRDAVTDWLDRDASSAAVRTALDEDSPDAFERELREGGWLGIGTPEDDGGQGGGLPELCLFAEALGAHTAPSALWFTQAIAASVLPRGNELLAALAEGEATAAFAARADRPLDTESRITAEGDRLTGQVAFVLGADRVDHFLVPVNTQGAISIWAVRVDDPGVTVTRRRLLDRSRSAADVSLTSAAGRCVAEDAAELVRRATLRAAVITAADALGSAVRMRELAVEYSLQRTQFGRQIGSFQAVKHAAAGMLVDEEAARSLVYFAAATVDSDDPESALHAAAAKAQVCGRAATAADTALTLHGAIGFTWEHDLQLFYKRAKLDADLFGASSTWNDRIASSLELDR